MPVVDPVIESDIYGVIFNKKNCQRMYKEIMGIPLSSKYIPLFFEDLGDEIFRAKIDLVKLKKKFYEFCIFQELEKMEGMKKKLAKEYFKKKILSLVRDAVSESQFTRKIDPDEFHKNHVGSAKKRFAHGGRQSYC